MFFSPNQSFYSSDIFKFSARLLPENESRDFCVQILFLLHGSASFNLSGRGTAFLATRVIFSAFFLVFRCCGRGHRRFLYLLTSHRRSPVQGNRSLSTGALPPISISNISAWPEAPCDAIQPGISSGCHPGLLRCGEPLLFGTRPSCGFHEANVQAFLRLLQTLEHS